MRIRPAGGAAWVVASVAASACATGTTVPLERTVPAEGGPRVAPTEVVLRAPSMPVELPAPEEDPILGSPWLLDPAFSAEVDRWVEHWSGRNRAAFQSWLRRMAAWGELVDGSLAGRGLPSSLRFLPLVESGYTPTAVSHASAVGLWQLMSPTARAGGLRVGALVDERRDPVRATAVALDYLDQLHDRFGSWLLALAAYNAGPTRVQSLLERHAGGRARSDGLFWEIRPHLPAETRHFVPRFIAAARLAADPVAHGLAPPPGGAVEWDEVTVPDATSLDVVAAAAGVGEGEVAALNPQILRRVTPRGVATTLRVPRGSGARFDTRYALIPAGERVTVAEHRVAAGETLWGIARRYGIALAALEEANPSARPERLRPGDRLVVPLAPAPARSVGGR